MNDVVQITNALQRAQEDLDDALNGLQTAADLQRAVDAAARLSALQDAARRFSELALLRYEKREDPSDYQRAAAFAIGGMVQRLEAARRRYESARNRVEAERLREQLAAERAEAERAEQERQADLAVERAAVEERAKEFTERMNAELSMKYRPSTEPGPVVPQPGGG